MFVHLFIFNFVYRDGSDRKHRNRAFRHSDFTDQPATPRHHPVVQGMYSVYQVPHSASGPWCVYTLYIKFHIYPMVRGCTLYIKFHTRPVLQNENTSQY